MKNLYRERKKAIGFLNRSNGGPFYDSKVINKKTPEILFGLRGLYDLPIWKLFFS
jgi:hypothetical protein